MDPEAPNLLHTHSHRALWSRANEKGVFPGVSTPLNWSIWGEIGERCVRGGAYDLGLLADDELEPPASADDWMWSIFYGRPAANVDSWRILYERGLAGGGAERQVFGDARSDAVTPSVRDRSDAIASKRPATLATAPERLRGLRLETEEWWRNVTAPGSLASPERCRAVFAEAVARFERADRDHIVVSLLSTEAVTAIGAAAEAAGLAESGNAVLVGYPDMEEFRTAVDLWDVSRGKLGRDAFLARHGFHGSQEGEIASRSWREEPEPIHALARTYESLAASDDPRLREERAMERRQSLEAELRAALPSEERSALDEALALAALCLPLREAGRATLTIALDAMRASAREIGSELARTGQLASAEEIFLLTRAELLSPPGNPGELVLARRALRETYQSFDLPETWQGMPEKQPLPPAATTLPGSGNPLVPGTSLDGLGVSPGVHEGTARVVLDPAKIGDDFAPGDVLVAAGTDPSWAAFFLVAGAVAIDTGSNISHAAVVAREMGIPAVVALGNASQRLHTGQKLRVDGGRGTVEVLD